MHAPLSKRQKAMAQKFRFAEGEDAFDAGKEIADCPYEDETERQEWIAGWRNAWWCIHGDIFFEENRENG